jgi:hypothetical protein
MEALNRCALRVLARSLAIALAIGTPNWYTGNLFPCLNSPVAQGLATHYGRIGGSIPPQATRTNARLDNDLAQKPSPAMPGFFVAASRHVATL